MQIGKVNFGKMDKKLLTVVLVLLCIGIIMVYSSSWPYALDINQQPYHFAFRQAFFAFIGLIAMFVASLIDYKLYNRWAIVIYSMAMVLCLLLFTPLGKSYDTFARRWIEVAGLSFMPSDLMKIASIVLLSSFLSRKKHTKNDFKTGFLIVIFIIAMSALPVYLQPNLSTTLTIIASLGGVYILSGMDLRYLLIAVPVIPIFGYLFLYGEKNAYRVDRLKVLLNPLLDFHDKGWQLSQALFAVSSGGFFGLGLGKSRQKYLYLSESHNDFIFAIIAEELGFLGSIIIIILFLLFIKFGFDIASRTRDEFGKLLASGITLVIGFQALVNMGVAFGVLPPTGLVLPFVSYGGTSLIVTLGMVGILLNISRANVKKR